MYSYRTIASRTLTAVVVAGSLIAIPGAAFSHSKEHAAVTDPSARQERMREHLNARLQQMEQKLQITPTQANAWTAYRQTIEDLTSASVTKPGPEADAVAITRFRAERAAQFAQKMSQVADATAALRQALEPEQRKTLDEMVRRKGRHGAGERGMR